MASGSRRRARQWRFPISGTKNLIDFWNFTSIITQSRKIQQLVTFTKSNHRNVWQNLSCGILTIGAGVGLSWTAAVKNLIIMTGWISSLHTSPLGCKQHTRKIKPYSYKVESVCMIVKVWELCEEGWQSSDTAAGQGVAQVGRGGNKNCILIINITPAWWRYNNRGYTNYSGYSDIEAECDGSDLSPACL